jgi:hypothetical protein
MLRGTALQTQRARPEARKRAAAAKSRRRRRGTHSDVLRRLAHGVYTMCTLLSLLPWMLFAFTS